MYLPRKPDRHPFFLGFPRLHEEVVQLGTGIALTDDLPLPRVEGILTARETLGAAHTRAAGNIATLAAIGHIQRFHVVGVLADLLDLRVNVHQVLLHKARLEGATERVLGLHTLVCLLQDLPGSGVSLAVRLLRIEIGVVLADVEVQAVHVRPVRSWERGEEDETAPDGHFTGVSNQAFERNYPERTDLGLAGLQDGLPKDVD